MPWIPSGALPQINSCPWMVWATFFVLPCVNHCHGTSPKKVPRGGGSCHISPARITFNPPKGTGICPGYIDIELPLKGGRRHQGVSPFYIRRCGGAPVPPTFSKILQGAGVFTFFGVQGGKKEGKIRICLVDFWSIFHNFLVLSMRKNHVIYNVFVPLASKKNF